MACEQTQERMIQALDGELDPAERAALNSHLARCADCRADWERLQALDRLMRSTPTVRPPAGFFGRTMSRLDRRHRVRRTALGALALAAGATAVVSLLLLPSLLKLSGLAGVLRPFLSTADLLFDHLVNIAAPMVNSLCLSLGALAYSLGPVAVGSMALALLSGLLWLGLVRRLHPATITWVRR